VDAEELSDRGQAIERLERKQETSNEDSTLLHDASAVSGSRTLFPPWGRFSICELRAPLSSPQLPQDSRAGPTLSLPRVSAATTLPS